MSTGCLSGPCGTAHGFMCPKASPRGRTCPADGSAHESRELGLWFVTKSDFLLDLF